MPRCFSTAAILLAAAGSAAISPARAAVVAWNGDTGNSAVADGANLLTINGAGATVINGAISGGGGLAVSGSGTLTLSAANSYTGTTTVSGSGTLVAANSSALGSATSAVQVSGSGTLLTGINTTISRPNNVGSSPSDNSGSATMGYTNGYVDTVLRNAPPSAPRMQPRASRK